MTSSNGNIFRVTGPFCGEFTGHRGEFPSQKPVKRSLDVYFHLRLNKRSVNNREAGSLRRHSALYDVTVMTSVREIIEHRNDVFITSNILMTVYTLP